MTKNDSGKMGLVSIILLGFNAIIGTGIFLLPNKIYALVGPAALGITVFDALLVLAIAMCFAELGGMFKANGGPYVYAKEAFGDFVGFEVGFMKWAIAIIAWATMAVAFAEVLMTLLPKGVVFGTVGITKAIIVTIVIVGLSAVNIAGIKMSKTLNNIVTTGKLLPLIIFVAVGIWFIDGGNFSPFFVPGVDKAGATLTTNAAIGTAAIIIFYAFTGFESIAVAAEDMENPRRDVPKAILLVIFICSIFYIAIIATAIGILGDGLATSKAPIQDAFAVVLGDAGKYLVGAGTIISIGGINIAASILTPRSGAALANDGLVPNALAKKNDKDVPYLAIIFTGIFTLALALYGSLIGSFAILAAISVVSRFVQYVPTCLAVIVLRKKRADLSPSFRVPFGPIIPILAVIVSFWLLWPRNDAAFFKIYVGLGGLVIGAVYYFIKKAMDKR
ncbi:MAG: amino acid permease [Campylobacteraceae bacterium]|nr:amino acid permease [Campylobacteraceae bacterium]